MEKMFQDFFKSGDTPEPIKMDIGEPVSGDANFNKKNIKDLPGGNQN